MCPTPASDSQNPAADPPINLTELLERCGGDVEFMGELLTIFRDETKRIAGEIHAAASDDDHAVMRELAHGLKGTAASSSAGKLADAANEVEQAAKDLADFQPKLAPLDLEIERALAEVDRQLERLLSEA